MKLISNSYQVDKSSIAWPLTTSGNVAAILLSTVLTGLSALLVYGVCTSSGTCDGSTWSDKVWGTPRNSTRMCEALHPERFMMQRTNSISNLCYLFAGYLLIVIGFADFARKHNISVVPLENDKPMVISYARNHMVLHGKLSAAFGAIHLLIGAFSFIFHSRMTDFTLRLDIAGISVGMAAGIVYSLMMLFWDVDEGRQAKSAGFILLFLAMFGALVPLLLFLDTVFGSELTTGGAGFLVIVLQLTIYILHKKETWRVKWFPDHYDWKLRGWKLVYVAAVVIGAAFLCKMQDYTWSGCDPEGFIQMHSIWHVLSAAGLWMVYLVFRSEAKRYYDDEGAILPTQEMGKGLESIGLRMCVEDL